MTDVSAEPPATRADLEQLSAESASRANVLHDELLRELHQQVTQLEQALTLTVRGEVEHGGLIHRSELRLLRQGLARQGSTLADVALQLDRLAGAGLQRAALALLLVAAVATGILVVAVAIAVVG